MIDTDKYEGHTEGPWIIETWRDGRSVYDIVRNDDKGDLVIANVLGTWEAKKPNMKPPSNTSNGFSPLNTTVARAIKPRPAEISLVTEPNQSMLR